MMKALIMTRLLLAIFLMVCNNSLAHEQAEDYRFNPFQFKLPEYNIKADVEELESIRELPENYKEVNSNGYSFFIPKSFKTKEKMRNALSVHIENGELLFIVLKQYPNHLLCKTPELEKDYCSIFNTRRDILYKTYTLTPEDLSKQEYLGKGFSWVVFYKGVYFEKISDIKIYERDGFMFFRDKFKPDIFLKRKKINVAVSSPKNDELLNITFTTTDEKLVMDILKSFQLSSN